MEQAVKAGDIRVEILSAGVASRGRMALIDADTVGRMARCLPVQSDECLMRTFGISANSWVKLKKGEPIRASVADHLIHRLRSVPSFFMENSNA